MTARELKDGDSHFYFEFDDERFTVLERSVAATDSYELSTITVVQMRKTFYRQLMPTCPPLAGHAAPNGARCMPKGSSGRVRR